MKKLIMIYKVLSAPVTTWYREHLLRTTGDLAFETTKQVDE